MGVDVRQIKKVGEGGMGEIWLGDILNFSMRKVLDTKDCIIKTTKSMFLWYLSITSSGERTQRIEESFIQEVSIMYLFRNCVNIAKVVF